MASQRENDSGAGDAGSRVRIEPIARKASGGARAPAATSPRPGAPRRRFARAKVAIGGVAALLAGALALSFLGDESPAPLSESPATSLSSPEEAPAGSVPAPGEAPAPTPPSAAASSADREEAARLLGEFQALAERLAAHADRWAAERYRTALALGREAEDAMIADDPARALVALERGLGLLREIDAETPQALANALEAGAEALERGNGVAAREHFEVALAIDPDDARAQRGLARVESLAEVLAEMAKGEEREGRSEWDAARAAYARALELDPEWKPAAAAVARIDRRLADARFARELSKGRQALAAGRLEDARASLRAALAVRPGSREAKDALAQVEQEIRRVAIGRAERGATDAEAREDWAEAVRLYEAALGLDDTRSAAREGLARSRERAALDQRLRYLLEDPTRLYEPAALREAEGLAATIVRVPNPGPRLRDQDARLRERVKLASTPISVEFASDKLTDVTIVRVQSLGAFDRLTLELRPGTYVVTGSRRGYRDVRKTLTVTPGEPAATVVVRCTETI